MARKTSSIKTTSTKPESKLECLSISYPHWRAYVVLRAISIILAFASLLSLGIVVEWNKRMLPATQGWEWGSWSIQWCLFMPGLLSWLWGITAISKLYFTADPLPAVADLAINLLVCISNILAFIYITTVTGPMQWWINKVTSKGTIVYAGIWETVGLVILIFLFLAHILLFVCAWRTAFYERAKRKRKSTLKGPRVMRKATPDEEAYWYSPSRKPSIDPWFRKYMGPDDQNPMASRDGLEDKAKRKTKFDLPMCKSKSELHLNRLGNSWECGSVMKK